MLLLLIAAHSLCDYPLQGDFLARAKNRLAPLPEVPWYLALGSHASIHGAAVGLVTGMWWLGLAEFVAHFIIDDLKCKRAITFGADQLLHFICKVGWVAVAFLM